LIKKITVIILAMMLVLPFVARADEDKVTLPQGTVPGVEYPVQLDKKQGQPVPDSARKAEIIRQQQKQENPQVFFVPQGTIKTVEKGKVISK